MIKSLTREEALDTLVQLFKPADLRWLWEQLDRLLHKGSPLESYFWDDDEPLPETCPSVYRLWHGVMSCAGASIASAQDVAE